MKEIRRSFKKLYIMNTIYNVFTREKKDENIFVVNFYIIYI